MASLHLAQEIFKLIYPVGSIYLSTSMTNPSTYFGGTWSRISDGYLFCTGDTSGTDGGKQVNLQGSGRTANHTLTIEQIPNHNHSISVGGTRLDANGDSVFRAQTYSNPSGGNFWNIGLARTGVGSHNANITDTGGNKGHSHNIPTTSVYVWKRTA